MKVVVGSTNPVKIDVTKSAFEQVFPNLESLIVEGVSVESGVHVQPKGRVETRRGAYNRARNARELMEDADFAVGIEGGVEDEVFGMVETAYVVVISKDWKVLWSWTSPFPIPNKVAWKIRIGKEHGPAADEVFGLTNSKQKEGTIGFVSDNLLTRTTFYMPAMITVLLPFKKPELYK